MPDDFIRVFISLPDAPEAVQQAPIQKAGAAENKSHGADAGGHPGHEAGD